jgi:hypothetical protein
MSQPAPGGGAMRATPTSTERASAGQLTGRADTALVEESASR